MVSRFVFVLGYALRLTVGLRLCSRCGCELELLQLRNVPGREREPLQVIAAAIASRPSTLAPNKSRNGAQRQKQPAVNCSFAR